MKLSKQILLLGILMATAFEISAQCITDQSVSINPTGGCGSAGGTIVLGSSETGINYALKDNIGNTYGTLVQGTGSSIELPISTTVNTSTTFQVVATKTTPISGGGLHFDGSDDYCEVGPMLDYHSGTWEAWVSKENWNDHHDDRLVWNGIDFPLSNAFYVSLHPLGMHFRYGGTPDAGNMAIISNKTISFAANSWHHLAATWNFDGTNTTIKIFIDGIEEASSTSSLSIQSDLNTFTFFGGSSNAVSNTVFFGPGLMDDYRLWNIAKPASEISVNMNTCLSGSESNLIAIYKFEEGMGNTASALTNNIYDATLNNIDIGTSWVSGKTCEQIDCSLQLTQSVELKVVKPAKPTVTATTKRRCGGGNVSFNTTAGGPYFAWYSGSAGDVNSKFSLNSGFDNGGSTVTGSGNDTGGGTTGSGTGSGTDTGSGTTGSGTGSGTDTGSGTTGSGTGSGTDTGSGTSPDINLLEINNGNYTTNVLPDNTDIFFSVFGVDSIYGKACYNTDGVTLNAIVDSLPQARTGSNTSICSGDQVTIGYQAINDNTYVWTPSTGLDHDDQSLVQASPSSDQTYTLTETIVETGCSKSNTVTITVTSCTSVDDPLPDGQLMSIYPNPSRDYTSVTYAIKSPGETILNLFNSSGGLVYTDNSYRSKGEFKTTIPIKEYPKGIYLLKITNGGVTNMQKIIVE